MAVSKRLDKVERRLLNITPRNCISRTPRSIVKDFSHWKASEFQSFLFFMASHVCGIFCLMNISAFYSSCGSNLAIRSDFSFTWVLTKSIQLVTALLLMTFCKKHSSCGFLTVVFYWFKIFFLGMVFEHILNLVL